MANEDLSSFLDSVNPNNRLRVEDDLGGGFVRLRVSEAERRQAKQDIRFVEDAVVEMLRNSRDAHARNIFLAYGRSGDMRSITIIDDGDGVPANMRDMIFEPRVTSKLDSMNFDQWGVHGRGMALYSIKENSVKCSITASCVGEGTAIAVIFDCSELSERADQSTMPVILSAKSGSQTLAPGPHNILRAACEFALSSNQCNVYAGSHVEMASALYSYGRLFGSYSLGGFEQVDDIAPLKRLSIAEDPMTFVELACGLGLNLSKRSAARILQGGTYIPDTIIDRCSSSSKTETSRINLNRDFRGVRFQKQDMSDFLSDVKDSYGKLADGYYLENDVAPEARVQGDRLLISIPIIKR